LSAVLRERDVPATVDLVDVAVVLRKWADCLATLAEAPAEVPVPAWLRTDPHGWADVLREHADSTVPHVAHWDIRIDNLLRRPGGEVVFLDWGMAARGAAWVDPLLARLERVEDPWFDASTASSPALRTVGDEAVTAFLAGFAAHLAVRSVVAVDVNLPTLRDFRVRESRRMLGAVARRTGR
jgi:aminoglycoside phosphotransferase (APT) family kinase protein